MSNLVTRIRQGRPTGEASRFTFNDLLAQLSYGGIQYALTQGGTPGQNEERIDTTFRGFAAAYRYNPVLFGCMATRQLVFSEARLQFQRIRNSRPQAGDFFGTPDLALFERPWEGGSTSDLLTRMINDADLAGNFYGWRRMYPGDARPSIMRLRPDWTTIILGSKSGRIEDAVRVGYAYVPGGPSSGRDPISIRREEVAHFAPYPDPEAQYRGMSWIQSLIDDVEADTTATRHKRAFFENGAKLGYVVTLSPNMSPEQFEKWVAKFRNSHEAVGQEFQTLFLAGGADVKTVGADLRQVDFKHVQGAGETRICAAARVPPILVGLSEGLESATYSNYGMAKRAFGDMTCRPMWRNAANSLAPLARVPNDARLWYDARDVAFLQEDEKDSAEIFKAESETVHTLVTAGYTPDSAVAAVAAKDMTLLEHSGMYSVQLQPAGTVGEGKGSVVTGTAVPAGAGASNGNGNGASA